MEEDTELITSMLHEKIGEAVNNNDIDAVTDCFAPNAIFNHASGSELYSTRFEGNEALTNVFSDLFESVRSISWKIVDERICGDKAYCEYIRQTTFPDREFQEFLTVDILTFKARLITHKQTYCKNRTQ